MTYIQRRGDGYLETVDEFATRKEALAMLNEYRLPGGAAMKFTFDPDMQFDHTNQAIQLVIEQEFPLDALMEVVRCNILKDEYGFAVALIRTYEDFYGKDEPTPPPGYTAAELDRDNPYNQWMEEA